MPQDSQQRTPAPKKNRGLAAGLAILLGWIGADQFYLGRVEKGAMIAGAYVILTLFLKNAAQDSIGAVNALGPLQIGFVLFGWWRAYEIFNEKLPSDVTVTSEHKAEGSHDV